MGAGLAALGGIGVFLLALFDKDDQVGEVRFGKFFSVKGVSLILMSVCGVALMGGCVYAWLSMETSGAVDDDDYWMMEELGYVEAWEEDAMWGEVETYLDDDDSAGL